MADVHDYVPIKIVGAFKGHIITGYADGTFLTAARSEDTFSKSVGAGGDVVRVRSHDRSGRITFTLQAESPSNDALSAFAQDDEAFGTGKGEILIKDLQGNTLLHADVAWIVKPADVERSKEAATTEWNFDCAELEVFVGGALL